MGNARLLGRTSKLTWFCFPGGWGCYDLNGIDEKQLAATGAHGYATEQQAQQHLNASPDVLQQGILQLLKAKSVLPFGAGVTGDLQTPSSTGGVGGALSNFFGGSNSGWLLRTVEIILGVALIAVGVARITRAVPPVTAIARQIGAKTA